MEIKKNDFIFLFLLAAVLLFQHAWTPGFFHDGHLYAAFGKTVAQHNEWLAPYLSEANRQHYAHHPPGLFIIEGLVYKIFGANWITARLLSASFALLAIFLVMQILKRGGLRTLAYLAALMFTILPPLFKKARSPGLDIPLMTCILLGLFTYFEAFIREKKNGVWWLLTGLVFALALWIKGPPAVILPLTMGFHLLLTKKLRLLISPMPWIGLIFGLAIFALWPFLLWQKGLFGNFEDYIQGQFFGTIVEGRGAEYRFWVYPLYLLECAGPWFVLSLVGLYQIIRHKIKDPAILLMLALFLTVLIPFSFVRWKYSNYIVPAFPAMCVLAAIPLSRLSDRIKSAIPKFMPSLVILVAMVLLIFPLAVNSKRDKEAFIVIDFLQKIEQAPHLKTHWYLINGAYPTDNLLNLVAWLDMGTVTDETQIPRSLDGNKQHVFLIHQSLWKEIKDSHSHLKQVLFLPSKDLAVLLVNDKNLK